MIWTAFEFSSNHQQEVFGEARSILKRKIYTHFILYNKETSIKHSNCRIIFKMHTFCSDLGTVIVSPTIQVFWASMIVFIISWVMQSRSYRKFVDANGG